MTIGSRLTLLVGPGFLVSYTNINQCAKDDHLSSVTATTPNMDQKWPKCYQTLPRHFCAACLPPRKKFVLSTLENFSTKNFFNNTACLRWPFYICTQCGYLRQVWLYLINWVNILYLYNPLILHQSFYIIFLIMDGFQTKISPSISFSGIYQKLFIYSRNRTNFW